MSRLRARIESRRATVAVVGLGYVGLPLLVAAGGEGFTVRDVDPTKIRSLRRGTSYVGDVSDEDIAGLPRAQFATDPLAPVAADVIVIAVPTPRRDIPPPDGATERRLASVPLDDGTLAAADCVVILTAHPDIDYQAVVGASSLVFDATGVTRPLRGDSVIRL